MLFSAALCRGLIEAAMTVWIAPDDNPPFSAALCRGLIEASNSAVRVRWAFEFSAALCRGLIEARTVSSLHMSKCGFPRLYAAASLKLPKKESMGRIASLVFRGFMPRPH